MDVVIGFEEMRTFVVVLCAILGTIAAVITSVGVIKKAISDALAPMRELDQWRKDIDQKLDNDNKRLNDQEKSVRLLLKAVKQLLEHESNGDNVDELIKVQHEIDQYLIER